MEIEWFLEDEKQHYQLMKNEYICHKCRRIVGAVMCHVHPSD
jgi:5-methylcytosine-specific restriction endonuclease McrA